MARLGESCAEVLEKAAAESTPPSAVAVSSADAADADAEPAAGLLADDAAPGAAAKCEATSGSSAGAGSGASSGNDAAERATPVTNRPLTLTPILL